MSLLDRIKNELDARMPAAQYEFKKLTKDDQPYYFVDWDTDNNQRRCLYYGFAARAPYVRDHQKRVPLSELANAIKICAQWKVFTRAHFEGACPVALSAGDCGYTVAGRCMEFLGIAEFSPDEHFFKLTHLERAHQFIDDD